MNVILDNISKDYEGKIVFKNISGRINKGDKIGLIGVNGIGKSTLAKIIAGLEGFEAGSIAYSPNSANIGYLNQSYLDREIQSKDSPSINHFMSFHNYTLDMEVKKLLMEMGITEQSWDRPTSTLSGGEKTKLMLARTLLQDFDLLILDEPTNHLDIESRMLLERLINKLEKTILIISHDRYFLDKTITKVWELTPKEIKEYSGNYSNYKLQRDIENKNALKEYQKQQTRIKELNEMISDRREWFDKAHRAAGQNDFLRGKSKKHVAVMKAKERQLQRIEENKVEAPREDMAPCFDIINKSLINTKLSRYLIQIKNVSKSYGDKAIFNGIAFDVLREDKIGIIGKNGSGKTTLLRMIKGLDKDFKGSISINPSVKIAYFSQQLETLDYDQSILDNVISEGISQTEARTLLANLMFKGEDVFKGAGVLSMGEKCRVAIAKIILSGANLLVLDEPTNYMDIVSEEKIEEVLQNFRGTILFVSHNRYFINSVANKILEVEEGNIKLYHGNYDFYLGKKQEEVLGQSLGVDYRTIAETITKLECQLAFIGGRLNEKISEEEKQQLNDKFIDLAKELRGYRERVGRK